jgi:F0F1-type ATP synthase membrane subunit a
LQSYIANFKIKKREETSPTNVTNFHKIVTAKVAEIAEKNFLGKERRASPTNDEIIIWISFAELRTLPFRIIRE